VNDDRVKMRVLEGAIPPSPTSSFTSDPFRHIQQCVQLVFGLDSVPALCIGNTDTRWYWSLSDNIFRFSPLALTLKETSMFHGLNERISVDALAGIVQFYISFIKMSCGPSKIN
jgi:carboxypeptidase PM20D1